MNFQELIYKVREAYENADARSIFEHIVVQFYVSGEITGAFYLEVAERKICIEPFLSFFKKCFTGKGSAVFRIERINELIENSEKINPKR